MVILLLGVIRSDARYEILKEKIDCIISSDVNDFFNIDALLLPFSGIDNCYNIKNSNINLIDILKNNSIDIIFTGTANDRLKEICSSRDIKLVELLKDYDFLIENSLLTASGIIDYLQRKGKSVKDQCIFIMGYGNISSSLAKLLKAYNSDFVICPHNEMEKKFILLNDYKLGDFEDLEKYNVIINTIPYNYIGDYSIFEKSEILDVASFPYGFDIDKIINHKIKYDVYSAIPSKYLLESAGLLVYKSVFKHLKKM